MTTPKLTYTNTHVTATIHRHGRDTLPLVGDFEGITHMRGAGSIVGGTMSKSIAPVPGTWGLTVKSERNLFEEIRPDDWIVISWEKNGVPYAGLLGVVGGVRRRRATSSGETVTTWSINGQDFTKVIAKTEVWFNDYARFESNVGGYILGRRFDFIPGGTPDAVVENILDAFLGSDGILGGAWILPRSLNYLGEFFVQGLRYLAQDGQGRQRAEVVADKNVRNPDDVRLRGELFDETSLFQPKPGTRMLALLQEWSNPLLNELFFDTAPVERSPWPEFPVPAVYHRERPFVSSLGRGSPWFTLPSTRFSRHDFVDVDVGTDDEERINMFMLYSSNNGQTQMDQYALYPPSYSVDSCRRHGIRKMENATRFSGIGGRVSAALADVKIAPAPGFAGLADILTSAKNLWGTEVVEWHGLLVSWYAANHLYLNGTARTRELQPAIRPGTRLIIGDDGDREREQFYVESVAHQWSFPAGGSTSLGLTRGWVGPDEDLIAAPVALAQGFQRKYADGGDGFVTTVKRAGFPARPGEELPP